MFKEKIMPRFTETDALGHINNTVLPVWFEATRTPIFRFFTPDLDPKQWKLIIAKIEVEFQGELFYGQEVEIKTAIRKIGNSSFVIEQSAWQHDEQCALGKTIVVRYDFDSKKSQALSEQEKNMLSEHLLTD